jgi:hypothetical protein
VIPLIRLLRQPQRRCFRRDGPAAPHQPQRAETEFERHNFESDSRPNEHTSPQSSSPRPKNPSLRFQPAAYPVPAKKFSRHEQEVVRSCTHYAQRGRVNIFIMIFCFSLSLAFFDPLFFINYLIGLAFFELFHANFMANAGNAWNNAEKSSSAR